MASADRDGRARQILGDLMTTTAMAVNEAIRDRLAEFDQLLDQAVAQIDAAEAEALAGHQAGICHDSEWSCSHCEAAQ
ncbi:MAG: hypothetical protein H6515_14175 [Microthrixaceae bacterium]|nr:hypothetical protein [Microthrixaceae bacterium]